MLTGLKWMLGGMVLAAGLAGCGSGSDSAAPVGPASDAASANLPEGKATRTASANLVPGVLPVLEMDLRLRVAQHGRESQR